MQADFQGLTPPEVLLCGLSGGADSVALVHLAKAMGFTVHAVHVNHCLRGAQSDADQAFVEQFCATWDIPLTVKTVAVQVVAEAQKMGVEEAARTVRYEAFSKVATTLAERCKQPVTIATAHTASDQVETILMRLVRGTGLQGLCGIPPRRDNIIRPLLQVSRADVERYCTEQGLCYVTDASNSDTTYTRNYLRHEVLPKLAALNPSLVATVQSMAGGLQADEQYLKAQTAEAFDSLLTAEGTALLLPSLQQLPEAIKRRVLLRFCSTQGVEPSATLIQRLLQVVEQGQGRCGANHGRFFVIARNRLVARREEDWAVQEQGENTPNMLPTSGVIQSKTGTCYKINILEITSSETFHKVSKNHFDILLDCGKICGRIQIRTRCSGDRIKLWENRPTVSLKKLFCTLQLPLAERDKRFVLVDDQGVIAVEGIGVAYRVKPDSRTTKGVQLTAEGEQQPPKR